jgi:capsular polysaccharide transport system permease protein
MAAPQVMAEPAAEASPSEVAVSPPPTAIIALPNEAAFPVRASGNGGLAVWRSRSAAVWAGAAQPRRHLSFGLVAFVLIVALPVTLAAIYYCFFAANQYVAEFRFGLRSAEPVRAESGPLFQPSAAQTRIGLDSYVVVQYIASRAIIDDLDKSIDVRRMFSSRKADWLARLHLPAPVEDLVTYWRGQVDAFFDPTNGTIVVRARAFTPEDALRLAQGILASSERLVNDLSARARRDALRNSEQDVRRTEQRLATALVKLRRFRDKEGVIDPRKQADASAALDGRVRDDLVRADTQLSTLQQYLQADAPALKLLQARIHALKAQRKTIESEVTNNAASDSQALSRIMGSYEELESERSFAETAYRHALEALDRARMNADRQHLYIADFVQPQLPEEALYPRRLRSIGIVSLIAFAAWAIGCLTVRSVRDHL